MRKIFLIALITLPFLAGCSNLRFPGVYRIDIPQGNFVTDEMLSQLQPGMTEEQVRYVLGVPTLRDPFTPDRWYYLMTYEPGKGETIRQDIIVHFDNGVYSRYEGEVAANMKRMTTGNSDQNLSKEADQHRRDSGEESAAGEESATDKDSANDNESAAKEATGAETSAETSDSDESGDSPDAPSDEPPADEAPAEEPPTDEDSE